MEANHLRGSVLCLIGVLCLTPDTLLLRSVGSNVPMSTILFVKFAAGAAFLSVYFQLQYGRTVLKQFKDLGFVGIGAGVMLGIANYFFTMAILTGVVANVLVIVACNSLFSALFSYALFNETMKLRTSVTCFVRTHFNVKKKILT
jgi:drug/metabolite transporter (DMT)-like permease